MSAFCNLTSVSSVESGMCQCVGVVPQSLKGVLWDSPSYVFEDSGYNYYIWKGAANDKNKFIITKNYPVKYLYSENIGTLEFNGQYIDGQPKFSDGYYVFRYSLIKKAWILHSSDHYVPLNTQTWYQLQGKPAQGAETLTLKIHKPKKQENQDEDSSSGGTSSGEEKEKITLQIRYPYEQTSKDSGVYKGGYRFSEKNWKDSQDSSSGGTSQDQGDDISSKIAFRFGFLQATIKFAQTEYNCFFVQHGKERYQQHEDARGSFFTMIKGSHDSDAKKPIAQITDPESNQVKLYIPSYKSSVFKKMSKLDKQGGSNQFQQVISDSDSGSSDNQNKAKVTITFTTNVIKTPIQVPCYYGEVATWQ